MSFTRRLLLKIAPFFFVRASASAADDPQPFGTEFPNLESLTTGEGLFQLLEDGVELGVDERHAGGGTE
jgi:hypothetical protein